ncbi:MAG: GDP-mannose 4,6-dehydratase [Methanoregula sp.]|jgi:CDP-glucose 4,6-dehydratase|uniref:GDP-mannose 4,6-dehydratase n=1 Tax=Methanoregula sp. TaxID=2052170 RepID=UPI003D127AFB
MENLEKLNFWKDRRVFITGATGVLGLNLVNRLISMDADVVAFVRDWVPRARLIGSWLQDSGKVTIVRGELEDVNSITRTLAEYETECIFHLGAQTIVNVGNRSPLTTFRANIGGTWNLLEAARILNTYSNDIQCICVASSDKAYGSSPILPYTEEMPLKGEHPYDVSKSCTDLIAQSYAFTYQLPTCIARMGNIYGPGDLNFNRIVPGTIRSLIEGKRPVIRSDGKPIREYFFVGDAVDAYLVMAESMEKKKFFGQAFNFSSGEKIPVSEMVKKIISHFGSDFEPEILNISRNEIADQYLSIAKAKKILGWSPEYSVDRGLELTIPWYREMMAK